MDQEIVIDRGVRDLRFKDSTRTVKLIPEEGSSDGVVRGRQAVQSMHVKNFERWTILVRVRMTERMNGMNG